MIQKPIYWRDCYLTDLSVYERSDWKGTSPPGISDFDKIHAIQIGEALYRALEKNPVCPDKDLAQSIQWVEVVLKAICSVMETNNRQLETRGIKFYIYKYGMNQFLKIYGADTHRILSEIDNMVSDGK